MLRKIIIMSLSAVIAVVVVATLLILSWYQEVISQPLLVAEDGYELKVEGGMGLNLLAGHLVDQGIIASALPLKIYARLSGFDDIKAGDYLLSKGETLVSLVDKLTRGAVRQYTVTFPEGWTLAQWRLVLAETSNLQQTITEYSAADIANSLSIENANPEGWFAPDTYMYRSGDSDLSILNRAHQAMVDMLAESWPARQKDLPYESPYQALVMASIIEKETGAAEERSQIAGVFVRRLEKGMLLQTDPTVIYGLGAAFRGDLTRQHLRRPSPYNTYMNRGLPPTPIANSGAEALHAALHPAPGKALYFVARGDGRHYFSATLDEHNKAVRKYQVNKRTKTYRSTPLAK